MQVPRIEKRIFSRWWVGGRGYVYDWAYLLSSGELVSPEQYRRLIAARARKQPRRTTSGRNAAAYGGEVAA